MVTIITGKAGSGKTRKGKSLCNGKRTVHLEPHTLNQTFGLEAITRETENILIDGCTRLPEASFFKQVIAGEKIVVNRKMKKQEVINIKNKNFIFIFQDKPIEYFKERLGRRFASINFIQC